MRGRGADPGRGSPPRLPASPAALPLRVSGLAGAVRPGGGTAASLACGGRRVLPGRGSPGTGGSAAFRASRSRLRSGGAGSCSGGVWTWRNVLGAQPEAVRPSWSAHTGTHPASVPKIAAGPRG